MVEFWGVRLFNEKREDFLFSIHPFYAEKIMSGDKTVELRRRFTKNVKEDAIALLYASSPTKAIIGYATIEAAFRLPISKLWDKYSARACIQKKDFDRYFSGIKFGHAILLKGSRNFDKAIFIDELREKLGFVPPQSFKYLTSELYSIIRYGQLQDSN